ncbi:MAG TPA: cytochrome c oxidase subunit 3 [Rhizomicrobium sp.]
MADAVYLAQELPVASLKHNSVGWWGMLCLIATESSLFVYLLFSYAFFAVRFGPGWLPVAHPSLKLALPDTIILLSSSAVIWWAEKGAKTGRRRQHLIGVAATMAMGLVFLIVQALEWKSKTYSITSSSYGSLYFTITGLHMAHVIVGMVILGVVFAWSAAGKFTPRRHTPVLISSTYWHFVDAVWVVVFTTLYLTPYLVNP